jgi:hypothetical protein
VCFTFCFFLFSLAESSPLPQQGFSIASVACCVTNSSPQHVDELNEASYKPRASLGQGESDNGEQDEEGGREVGRE